METTVTISCEIGTTNPSIPLGIEIWLDQDKIFDLTHVTDSFTFMKNVPDNEAEHNLRFIMKNKLAEHTQIDNVGTIIKDANLTVSNIQFDNIALGQIVINNAVYTHDFNGTGLQTEQKFYGEMGCNGTVSLKFSTPMYVWMLEHM